MKMNILYIDKNTFQTQTRINLITEMLHHHVELATTIDDVYKIYKKNKYTVVIMDHAIEIGRDALNMIMDIDPQQRILTISAEGVERSVPQGCDYCVEHHSRRRLYNPTPIKNILRMIEGFDDYVCDHYAGKAENNLR
jgi:hypothetical protein